MPSKKQNKHTHTHTKEKARKQNPLKPCKSISTEVHTPHSKQTHILTSRGPLAGLRGGNRRDPFTPAAGSWIIPHSMYWHSCTCTDLCHRVTERQQPPGRGQKEQTPSSQPQKQTAVTIGAPCRATSLNTSKCAP